MAGTRNEEEGTRKGEGPGPWPLNPTPSALTLVPSPLFLTVSDVKQYPYCPRIVYYSYLLPLRARPATYKMAEGKLEHERVADLEERRSLRAYGLSEGVRRFDVSLSSDRLGLRGRLDMVIETPGEVIPVDFKNSQGKVGLNHKYQLTAYALLVEEQGTGNEARVKGQGSGVKGQGGGSGSRVQGAGQGGVSTLDSRPSSLPRPVRRGFIYLAPQKRAWEVRITSNMRGWVKKALREIREMLEAERMPPPTRMRGRCTDCEFRNLCNDV